MNVALLVGSVFIGGFAAMGVAVLLALHFAKKYDAKHRHDDDKDNGVSHA